MSDCLTFNPLWFISCMIHGQELVGVKGVISQQVGLGVKADSSGFYRMRVTALTP